MLFTISTEGIFSQLLFAILMLAGGHRNSKPAVVISGAFIKKILHNHSINKKKIFFRRCKLRSKLPTNYNLLKLTFHSLTSNVAIDVIVFTFYSDQLTIDVETGILTKFFFEILL